MGKSLSRQGTGNWGLGIDASQLVGELRTLQPVIDYLRPILEKLVRENVHA